MASEFGSRPLPGVGVELGLIFSGRPLTIESEPKMAILFKYGDLGGFGGTACKKYHHTMSYCSTVTHTNSNYHSAVLVLGLPKNLGHLTTACCNLSVLKGFSAIAFPSLEAAWSDSFLFDGRSLGCTWASRLEEGVPGFSKNPGETSTKSFGHNAPKSKPIDSPLFRPNS